METMGQGLLNALYVLSSIIALVGLSRIDKGSNWFTRAIHHMTYHLAFVNLVIALLLSLCQLIMGKI